MKHFFSALILLTPALTFGADFTGRWSANVGKVSSNVGLSSNCTKVEIDIEQRPATLTVKRYHSDCGPYGSTWGPDAMTLKADGKVFEGEDEDEVGTLTGNTLMTISHEGGTAYAFNLKLIQLPDGSETLESYYGVHNGTGAIVTEADLKR
jgi:hypothetical protein